MVAEESSSHRVVPLSHFNIMNELLMLNRRKKAGLRIIPAISVIETTTQQ